MKHVYLYQPLLQAVRDAVWAKAYEGGKVYNYETVTQVLEQKLGDEASEWEKKIKNVLKSLKDHEVNSETNGSYFTFARLCDYLGLQVNARKSVDGNRYEYDKTFAEILEDLFNEKIIEKDIYEKQRQLLAEKGLDEPRISFALYYSLGRNQPGIAFLDVDIKKGIADLRYKSDKTKIFSGTSIVTGGKLFIHLKNLRNDSQTFLTLASEDNVEILRTPMLTGIYCSTDLFSSNDPAAVRAVAVRVKDHDRLSTATTPANIEFLLYNQQLLRNGDLANFEKVNLYTGNYVGYWFAVRRTVKVIQCTLEIKENGTCILKGAHSGVSEGSVVETNEDAETLRCEFSYTSSKWKNNLQMMFDIRTHKKGYLDGAYQGMEPHQSQIMAGRIRFYKIADDATLPEPQSFNLSELPSKVPEKADELINFFWGTPKEMAASRFFQPNYWTFTNLYGAADSNHSESNIGDFNGSFLMYKRDSKQRRINQYPIKISEGNVSYTLDLDDGERKYAGTAVFTSSCLILKIVRRDNKPYQALYLFYIGGRFSSENKYLNGVYATYSHSGSPVCGRVVLKVKGTNPNYKPILFDSEEFYKYDSQNEGALSFLAGVENNLIKSGKNYDLFREIDYAPVFFHYACHGAETPFEKAQMLKYAFDNGFRDYDLLAEELKGNLKTVLQNKMIKDTPVSDRPKEFEITLSHGRHPKTYIAISGD